MNTFQRELAIAKAAARVVAASKRCVVDLLAHGRADAHRHGFTDAECDLLLTWYAKGCPVSDEWLERLTHENYGAVGVERPRHPFYMQDRQGSLKNEAKPNWRGISLCRIRQTVAK